MAVKRIKLKAGEDISGVNVQRAIDSMIDGGTKKDACAILGISYNTKRLQRIIDGYHDRLEFEKKQKAKRRGKPVDNYEAVSIIEAYLITGSMEAAAKQHWRSTSIIKQTLLKHGALLKAAKSDYFNPMLLPDESMAEDFAKGDLVWSARYNNVAEVDKVYGNNVYRIWVLGTNCRYAMQPVEELGSLKHLEKLGVNITRIIQE